MRAARASCATTMPWRAAAALSAATVDAGASAPEPATTRAMNSARSILYFLNRAPNVFARAIAFSAANASN